MKKILFISDQNYFNASNKGGVQLCTDEYFELLQLTPYPVSAYTINSTKQFLNRLLIKLGLNLFHHYDYARHAEIIGQKIQQEKIDIIALNQVNLIPLANFIKPLNPEVKIIVLSHGNESGDFLHEIADQEKQGFFSFLKKLRLGRLLVAESQYFSHYVDLLLCISKEETIINQWLGAHNCFFVPRLFKANFLNWQPKLGLIGFVGTLSHAPNYQGILKVCKAIANSGRTDIHLQIVGNGQFQGNALQKQFPFVAYLGAMDNQTLEKTAATWSMFLNPVFQLSRGASTKLATGINWGIPIVSTPFGNRGYEWNSGSILTCQSAEEMAEIIINKSLDQQLLNELSCEVKKVAESGRSIEVLAKELTHRIAALG